MKLLLPLLLIACSGRSALPEEAFTVSGTVTVNAALVPKPRAVALAPACAAIAGGPLFEEERRVDKDGGVPGAIVHVKRGLEGRTFERPAEKAVIRTRGHRLVPAVLGIRAGQELTIRNEDDHAYCVHALPFENKEFNVGLPKRGVEFTKRFDKAELPIRIKDDCHPWMGAWIGVFSHPYFAVTDASGKFEIKGLPPGRYVLELWHPRYSTLTQEIDLKAALTLEARFLKLRE